jgi:hypothetical protein
MKIIKVGTIPKPYDVIEELLGHTFQCGHCGTVVELEEPDGPLSPHLETVNKTKGIRIACPLCQKGIYVWRENKRNAEWGTE